MEQCMLFIGLIQVVFRSIFLSDNDMILSLGLLSDNSDIIT